MSKHKILNAALSMITVIITVTSGYAFTMSHEYSNLKTQQIKRQYVDTIAVPDMQCSMCEKRITEAVKKIKGVVNINADAEQKRVIVTTTRRSLRKNIEKAIVNVGYDAGTSRTNQAKQQALPSCCQPN